MTLEEISEAEIKFGRFVHMSPLDKAIWAKWLLNGGDRFAPFEYDVRVGDGVEMPEDASETEIKLALALTTKRIDATSKFGGVSQIYEVKPRAGFSAIGQLVGYKTLYRAKFPTEKRISMILVTDRLQPDMIQPLAAARIAYIETGE